MLNERQRRAGAVGHGRLLRGAEFGALPINPFDIVDTADGAGEGAGDVRARSAAQRQAAMRDAIAAHQTSDWLKQQLRDLSSRST